MPNILFSPALLKLNRLCLALVSLAVICISSSQAQASNLAAMDLQLSARSFGFPSFSAQGNLELKPQGNNQYQMKLAANARLGSLSEESRFSWQDGQISSQSYSSTSRLTFFSEQKRYQFSDSRITGRVNNNQVDTANRQTLDPLNRILAIGLLAQDQDEFSLSSISWRSANQQQFRVVERGMANTHLGQLDIMIVEQLGNRNSRFYYATEYPGMPILWQQFDDERLEFEVRVESAQFAGQTVLPN